ncbi:MAG TPA: rhomboid family intramembrane serine protease [Gammaproteobacteria bacterium]|nr:rhomboid family intramembrane serine protease [Gammaproteobacteria bacterium]
MTETVPSNMTLTRALVTSVLFVLLLWWIRLAETLFGWDLSPLGVAPREWSGLIGVFTAPLVHGSWEHLVANTPSLVLLGTALLYGYPRASRAVIPAIWLGSGLGVWLFARASFHIGASGLTHGFMFFLFIVGLIRRDRRSIVLAMLTFFLYGGMVWGIFPQQDPLISFEYHFTGALMGIISAFTLRGVDPKPPEKRYSWEEEPPDAEDPVIGDLWKRKTPPPPEALENTDEFPLHGDDEERWH